uniref:Nuclear pore complex protein Nup98-Nup96 n=1 Tax=Mesocestoides corti TaxID=53468 RepID=A0A5K3FP72_MESCO
MFGQSKPVFGTSPSTCFAFGSSPFGQASASQPTSGLFGQPTTSTQQTSMFGGSVFGATPTAIQGTTVKFNPPISTDTVQKNGQKLQVNTKHMCITAMKEYQEKSLEELRVEDYLQNRKSGSGGGAAGFFGTGPTSSFGFGAVITTTAPLFGSAPTAQTAPSSIFGSTGGTGTSIFGSPQPMNSFGQSTQNSVFGNKPLFGVAGSTASSLNSSTAPQTQTGFGFGQTMSNSIFASNPTFGAPSTTTSSFSLFGSQPVSSQPGGFAFGKSTGTSIFGTTTTTTPSLFGSPQPATQTLSFGQPASSQSGSIFGGVKSAGTSIFGSAAPTTTASAFGSGFGTGFGTKAPTASVGLFGTTQTGPTGFGLGTTATSTAQPGLGTSLFGAKKPSPFGTPASGAAPSFGFGATTSTSGPTTNIFGGTTGFGLGSNSQPAQPVGGIFGGTNTAPAGGLFSKPTVTGFGLSQNNSSTSIFGASSGAATGSAAGSIFGGGLGTTPTVGFGGVTGTNSTAFGTTSAPNQTVLAPLVEQLTQNARAQQHVLDLVRSMPYGQSALFRHLTAESSSPSTAPTSASAPSANSTAKTSGVSVLSGSAAANTIAEMHKANSLSVGSYPGRIGNGLATRRPMQILPVNRRQVSS